MSDIPNTNAEALRKLAFHHRCIAEIYEATAKQITPTLGQLAEAAGISTEAPAPIKDAVVDPPAQTRRRAAPAQVDPAPAPAATAPAAAPAAQSAPAPAAVPAPASAPANDGVPPLSALIQAMQAHAKAKAASGGAISTLKKLKSLDKSYTTGSSVPAEKRADVIAALNADAGV